MKFLSSDGLPFLILSNIYLILFYVLGMKFHKKCAINREINLSFSVLKKYNLELKRAIWSYWNSYWIMDCLLLNLFWINYGLIIAAFINFNKQFHEYRKKTPKKLSLLNKVTWWSFMNFSKVHVLLKHPFFFQKPNLMKLTTRVKFKTGFFQYTK